MNGLQCPLAPGQYTIEIPISIPEADVLDPDKNVSQILNRRLYVLLITTQTKYIMHSEASLEGGDGLGCVEVEVTP